MTMSRPTCIHRSKFKFTVWKKLQRSAPQHRARQINNHINTCTHVSLHVINLTDWHVRQPLGRPLLVRLASRLAHGYKCQRLRCGVVVLMLWKKNIVQMGVTFARQPLPELLSSGERIKLIYDWKSLSSIFWWPLHVTRWYKSLPSERAAPMAVHFNLMPLISSPCAENYTPPTCEGLKQSSGLSRSSFRLNELLEGISTRVNTINLIWVYSKV